MKPAILAVCGVAREARIAEAAGGVMAIACGGRAEACEARLDALAAAAGGVASFGLCGALADVLRIGDVVIGSGGDAGWSEAVDATLARKGGRELVFADGTLASTPAAKCVLHDRTGAVAIDMESHVAARVAARRGLPLLILRVVSDSADQTLPPAFARAMRPDGTTDIGAMLASIARQPGQVPRVIAASRDAMRALGVLRRLGRALGPRLGLPDLG